MSLIQSFLLCVVNRWMSTTTWWSPDKSRLQIPCGDYPEFPGSDVACHRKCSCTHWVIVVFSPCPNCSAVDADVGFWYPSNRLQLWQWQLPCQPPHEWCWNDRVQCLYLNQSEFFSGVLFRFVVFGGVCVTVDLKKINFLRWHYTHRRAQFSGSL